MERQRILEAWNSYRLVVMPADAPPIQVSECRRAFYAGALTLLEGILNQLSPGLESEESDLKMMDEIHRELLAFNESVKAGTA